MAERNASEQTGLQQIGERRHWPTKPGGVPHRPSQGRKGSTQLNSLEPYKSTPWLAIMALAVTMVLTSTNALTSVDVHQLVALLIATVSALVMTRTPPDDLES